MTKCTTIMFGAALALGAMGVATAAHAGGDVYGAPTRQAVPAAIPVPAPAPIPEIATGWYLRVDAAYGQGDVAKYKSTTALADQVRGDSYLDNYPRYGIGVGYQLRKWLRTDVTIDWRNDVTSKGYGQVNYTIPNAAGGVDGGGNPLGPIAMRDTYSDSFTSTNITGLINLYADVPVSQTFTPYVGAGIGFVRHQLKGRVFSRTTTCVDTIDCDPGTVDGQVGSTVDSFASAIAGGTDYALAAALMAGFSYKVWDNTKIDIGYRWLHLAGTHYAGKSANVTENLTIPDQNVHELRAGLRFEIN